MILKSESFPFQDDEVERQKTFSPGTPAHAPRVSLATVKRWKSCKMASSELAQRQFERER